MSLVMPLERLAKRTGFMRYIVDFLNRRQRTLAVFAGFGLVAIAAAYYTGMGVVIDETTGKPVDGVFVVGRWRARQITPIESSSVCFKVDSTETDGNGRFMLWPVSWSFDPRLWSRERRLIFYKRGYRLSSTEPDRETIVTLKPDTAATEDRLNYVSKLGLQTVCGTLTERTQYLLPLYKAMIVETSEISGVTNNPDYADEIVWLAETLTLGSNVATDNLLNKPRRIRIISK